MRAPELARWSAVRRPFLIQVILLLALLPSPAAFAQTLYTISGSVKQPDGFPVSRATINITSSTGLNQQAYSDDMGRYELPNIPRGRYYIMAVNSADPDQFMEQVVVELGRDMTTRVTVHLYLRYRSKVVDSGRQAGVVSLEEEMSRAPKAAQKHFEQAVAFRSKRKYAQALESFNKAIQVAPDYFQAIAERGHLYIAMNQPSMAVEDFSRALEIIPRYGPALRGAGLCEFQQGRYAEAIDYLKRASDTEPGNVTNHLFIGAAHVALDHRDEARAALQKALGMDPAASARAHVHLANLYLKENRRQEAIQEIESYLKAVPEAPDAANLRQILAQLQSSAKP